MCFSLWAQNATSVSVRVHGTRPINDVNTRAVEVVEGQWVNVQMWLDRQQGYEIRSYDGYRNLKESINVKALLPTQSPEARFRLF